LEDVKMEYVLKKRVKAFAPNVKHPGSPSHS
jgi:hypothetical protein